MLFQADIKYYDNPFLFFFFDVEQCLQNELNLQSTTSWVIWMEKRGNRESH